MSLKLCWGWICAVRSEQRTKFLWCKDLKSPCACLSLQWNCPHSPLLKAITLTASILSPVILLESAMETVYTDSKQSGLHECNWGQNLSWHILVPSQTQDVIPREISQIPGKNVWISSQPCDLFCWPVLCGWKVRLMLNNVFALFSALVPSWSLF